MKKFTTLDEDLLKESQSAEEKFNSRFDIVQKNLQEINIELNRYKAEYFGDPSGRTKSSFGYNGSLGYINMLLNQILDHMTDPDNHFWA
jgi:hypothetical protein